MREYSKVITAKTVYKTKLFEIIEQEVEYQKKEEKGTFTTEVVLRSPGVRLIITQQNRILLAREYRFELGSWDYRLPGGRIFDLVDDFIDARNNPRKLLTGIENAVIEESIEEAGLRPLQFKLECIDKLGASILWDLHFYHILDFTPENKVTQVKEKDKSEIIYPEWHSFEAVKELILDNKISESRTAGVLLKFIFKNSYL